MAKKIGLGRGLDALFSDNSTEDQTGLGSVMLKISELEPNKAQPRKTFNEQALAELSESIARNGVIQPLLVRPLPDGGYQIVAGERRWRASRMAGLTEVPAVIRELSDEQAMELALIENLQREDLNAIEEAEALHILIEAYHLTQEEAAARVGRSRAAVANSLRLLGLPEKVREYTRMGKISASHARTLLAFEDKDRLMQVAELLTKQDIAVRELERWAKSGNSGQKKSAAKKRDPFFDEAELALTAALGRRVRVINGREKGVLEIEYYGREDLSILANSIADKIIGDLFKDDKIDV